jgi:hypothetical protein
MVSIAGLCAAPPGAGADRADAEAARREGNVSWAPTPVALAQQLADAFQQQTG